MDDIFDTGKPKYQMPEDIYDAVCTMASGEEIGILSDMFGDVSWEGQEYYYTDAGQKLQERIEKITDGGYDFLKLQLAAAQMDGIDSNDWIGRAQLDEELSKRIGFKNLFIDCVLGGYTGMYSAVQERFYDAVSHLDRYDYMDMRTALAQALHDSGLPNWNVEIKYRDLCRAVYGKIERMKLTEERALIAECRAMLTAYDDFMFGLRSNQQLHEYQEQAYRNKVAQLEAEYREKVEKLLMIAQAQGVTLELPDAEIKLLEGVETS